MHLNTIKKFNDIFWGITTNRIYQMYLMAFL
ncbi:Uncharacterised protein [Klebsiella pneumoniae]|nr:Uncharacterised protein [Klebsiella pneumoniae]